MNSILTKVMDWSEIWALLIPLTIFVICKPQYKWTRPILVYLCLALVINFIIDVIYIPYMEDKILSSNHIFYNLSSLNRFICFAWFFNYLHPFFRKLNRFIPFLFLLTIMIYYIFLGSFFVFSSSMMALEAALIVVYCISWFNIKIHDDSAGSLFSLNSSWVVVGISLYSCVNFFIFLFYKILIETEGVYAFYVWDVHNALFILKCISFGIAFSRK